MTISRRIQLYEFIKNQSRFRRKKETKSEDVQESSNLDWRHGHHLILRSVSFTSYDQVCNIHRCISYNFMFTHQNSKVRIRSIMINMFQLNIIDDYSQNSIHPSDNVIMRSDFWIARILISSVQRFLWSEFTLKRTRGAIVSVHCVTMSDAIWMISRRLGRIRHVFLWML